MDQIPPDSISEKAYYNNGIYSASENWKTEAPQKLEPIDVWALGCIFMEMISFVQGGPEHLQILREARESEPSMLKDKSGILDAFHNTEALKAPVQNWLRNLEWNPKYAHASGCIQAMLRQNPEDRLSAREVSNDLMIDPGDHSNLRNSIPEGGIKIMVGVSAPLWYSR